MDQQETSEQPVSEPVNEPAARTTPEPKNEAPTAQPKTKQSLNPAVRQGILAGLALLLLLIVIVVGNINATREREAALARGVDALSESVKPLLLARDPEKATQVLTAIAQAGKFKSMTLVDREGTVLAATDRTRQGKKFSGILKGASPSKVITEEGVKLIRRPIFLGENNLFGGLEVVPD